MTEIIFCQTDHNYESYRDFWTLVSLSGFPIIKVSELDISKPGVYITTPMNRDWRNHINSEHKQYKAVNAHLILWNLERPSGSAHSVPQYSQQCHYLQAGLWENGKPVNDEGDKAWGRFIDDIWVSDRRLAQEIHQNFVILGSDEGLGKPGADKKYSFCHMSYEVNRRKGIYDQFNNGNISVAPNAWPPERDEILRHTKFAVNVHQDNHPFQEPLRFALFAAYGLPIITETIHDSYPWSDEFMIYSDYDGLPGKIREVLNDDYERWRAMGLKARIRMTQEFQFGKMVRQAVEESGLTWR